MCCNDDSFKWDGQHLTCKHCGVVLIREQINAKTLREMAREKKVEDTRKHNEMIAERMRAKSLLGHYDKMKNFKGYLNDVGFVDSWATESVNHVDRSVQARRKGLYEYKKRNYR